jgi:putative PIN family toxin of toxin-antitoxin system
VENYDDLTVMYIFDTNVLVSALRSRQGASFVILQAIRRGLVAGSASTAMLLEYADVFKRDSNLRQFWMEPEEVDATLGVLATVLEPVVIDFRWRPQLRDPNDEMVLECAVNAQAKAIVTFNRRDFLPGASRFGVEVLQPNVLVKQLNLVERLKR